MKLQDGRTDRRQVKMGVCMKKKTMLGFRKDRRQIKKKTSNNRAERGRDRL